MKDQQGFERGPCEEDCLCVEYVKPKNGDVKCDYCGHNPTKHKMQNKLKQETSTVIEKKEEIFQQPEVASNNKQKEDIVFTPSSVPKKVSVSVTPAVAISSKPVKKKGLLEELKNPKQFIKEKRKQKKA